MQTLFLIFTAQALSLCVWTADEGAWPLRPRRHSAAGMADVCACAQPSSTPLSCTRSTWTPRGAHMAGSWCPGEGLLPHHFSHWLPGKMTTAIDPHGAAVQPLACAHDPCNLACMAHCCCRQHTTCPAESPWGGRVIYEAVLIAFVATIPTGSRAEPARLRAGGGLTADLLPGAPGCPDYNLAIKQLQAAHAGAGNCRSGNRMQLAPKICLSPSNMPCTSLHTRAH